MRMAREDRQGPEEEEEEEGDERAQSKTESSESHSVNHDQSARYMLKPLAKACLEFCMTLLDERITREEYDSVLVCGLAVLGVKDRG